MNTQNALKNFDIAVNALYNEAPNDKAREFVGKIANAIRAKGYQWIADRMIQLHITDAEVNDDAYVSIEENRLFYMKTWQLALIK